jgi:hypothetical protein
MGCTVTRDYLSGYLYFQRALNKQGREESTERFVELLEQLPPEAKTRLNQGLMPAECDDEFGATHDQVDGLRNAVERYLRWLNREKHLIDTVADRGFEAAKSEVALPCDDDSGDGRIINR